MSEAQEKYQVWLNKVRDEEVLGLLKKMDATAVENAFFKDLSFGTGGLRGEIGAGSNCMNVYTVARATKGVAEYVRAGGGKTAAVSYDSRIHSDLFARTAASVLAGCGLKVYLVRELMPTPFLSFAVRQKRADIGVMVTASHNPAKYNGYKVYGADGCQITDAAAGSITEYIDRIDPFEVEIGAFDALVAAGKIEYLGDETEGEYLSAVKSRGVGEISGLSVVYSPLNGTGYRLVPKLLNELGLRNLTVVDEQVRPDGNFPTCPYPNPEKAEALALGLTYAKKRNADILLATDPDADRVGIAVRQNGEYVLLTGNEVGVLLTDYLFSRRKALGTLPVRPVLIKTIVTTPLADRIAAEYGAKVVNVLTGFKYIGEQIGKLEKEGAAEDFVLGFEESYGYLAGSYVRDKDALVGAMLILQMASHHKERGATLVERLQELYAKYGCYEHKLKSYEFGGAEGNARMRALLAGVRGNLPERIAGLAVTATTDYLTQTEQDLPKSDVLQFALEGGAQLVVRPSGTEPLVKVYLTACGESPEANGRIFSEMLNWLDGIFQA